MVKRNKYKEKTMAKMEKAKKKKGKAMSKIMIIMKNIKIRKVNVFDLSTMLIKIHLTKIMKLEEFQSFQVMGFKQLDFLVKPEGKLVKTKY